MLIETPKWSYRPKNTDPAHFNAYLHRDKVVGNWFSISTSGSVYWDRTHRRANLIKAVVDNKLIATHYYKHGCHAFDIESGGHLWSYPTWSLFPFGTFPIKVDDQEIICSRGERLDLNSGLLIGRTPATVSSWDLAKLSETWVRDPEACHDRLSMVQLMLGLDSSDKQNAIAEKFHLKHIPPSGLQRLNEHGPVWSVRFREIPYAWQYSVNNICLCYPYLFVVIPETFNLKGFGCRAESVPTTWRFLSFDLDSGALVQDFSLGDDLCGANIADANNDFVLISYWKRNGWTTSNGIALFERVGSAQH
jgi:hypothetical protein